MDFLRRLLTGIADAVFPPRDHERAVRALADADILPLRSPKRVERCRPNATALFPFRHPHIRALVHEAKYRGNARAQDLLGRALAAHLAERRTEGPAFLVPIPLSKKRRAERGYNQCEEIARRALAALPDSGIRIDSSLLLRPKETEHQTRLSRLLRRENLADAFAARGRADADALYIVFDDVVTTGATLEAAAGALREAGARHIAPLALAH